MASPIHQSLLEKTRAAAGNVATVEPSAEPVPTPETRHSADLALLKQWAADNDAPIVADALQASETVHRTQLRGPTPYIEHTAFVAAELVRRWDTEQLGDLSADTVTAALLHDALEDQPAALIDYCNQDPHARFQNHVESRVKSTLQEASAAGRTVDEKKLRKSINEKLRPEATKALTRQFGPGVTDLVLAVTNPTSDQRPAGLDSNAAYAAHLTEKVYPQLPLGTDPAPYRHAVAIKACDQMDNAGTVHLLPEGPRRDKLARKYREPTAEAAAALDRLGMPTFAEPLAQAVSRVEAIAIAADGADLHARIERLSPRTGTAGQTNEIQR